MSYLKVITPTNLAVERERFFSIDGYSPQLDYDWDEHGLERFLEKTSRGTQLVKALLEQDGEAITREAAKFFDVKFREEDIDFAKKLFAKVPAEINGTAEQYAEIMRNKLAKLGIDYEVKVVDEHGFQGRPNHKRHLMKISKYAHLQFLTPGGVANHELVHIVRAVNGEYNGIPKSENYLATEEGLACLVQDKFLTQLTASAFQHALEYSAANLSRTAGLREIYNFLMEHGSDAENAWLRGIRQKFGMRDTAQPGGLVKSGMYFYHENILRELSKEEILRLFVGKISLDELAQYPEYKGIIPREAIEEVLFGD